MNTKEALEKDIDAYIRISQANNFEGVVDYMYPGIFKLIPKEMLLEKMKESFNGSSYNDYVDGFFISAMSDIVEINQSLFCKVTYVINLKTDPHSHLVKQLLEGEDVNYDSIDDYLSFTLSLLTTVYGEGNVKYDEGEACFRIQQINEMLAVYEKGFDTWKLIKYGNGSMFKRLFPAKTVKKLSTYFFLMD